MYLARRKHPGEIDTGHNERAGLYVRVSMDRSARGMTEEIVSPTTQEDRARAYCQAQGWQVVQVEHDIDESAYRQHYSKRAGLMRLLDAVQRGEITKIVVWKFSRLSRRLREFSEICDTVERANGGVVSVSEQVDTSTPAGRLIRNILASFAQFQAEEIGEQIYETWLTRAKQGLKPPGQQPFGTINRRGVLEPDPETHPHLLALFRTYAETGSLRACWDYLNQAAVEPPRAEGWHLVSIRKILRNSIYAGRLGWDGEEYTGQWEPLVPLELWEKVQSMLESRSDKRERRRDARLLSGLVICGNCGLPMWIRYEHRQRRELLHLYSCFERHSMRRGCSETPNVVADELEREVWDTIRALAHDGGLGPVVAALSSPNASRELEQVEKQIQRLRAQIATLFDMVGVGDITREEFREQHRRYSEQLRTLQIQLVDREAPMALPHIIARALESMGDASTLEERRGVLEALGVTITVTGSKAVMELAGHTYRLRPRLVAGTMHFGREYHRLDYQGHVYTDWQLRFLARTWNRFDRRRIAERMGRSLNAIHRAIYRMQDKASTTTTSR